MDQAPFKTGDIVRLRTGTSPIQVQEVDYFQCASNDTKPPIWFKRCWGGGGRNPTKGWYIRFAYMSSLHYKEEGRKWREASDFCLYDPKKEKERILMAETPILYQTLEPVPRFGTELTKTRVGGKIVLEMKGKNGDVESFAPSELKEVLPYTVAIKRFDGSPEHGVDKGEPRHYAAKEGEVEVGDVLMHLSNTNMYEVVAVDTGKRHPSKTTNGFFKVAGSRVLNGS